MTTVNQLKLAAGAGEPDNVLALRIDVIKAAHDWYEAVEKSYDFFEIDAREQKLFIAVRKHRSAVRSRAVVTAAPWLDAP